MWETSHAITSSTPAHPRLPYALGKHFGHAKRLSEQQVAIAAILLEGKVLHLMPEAEEWTVIEDLVCILQPFQDVTEAISTTKYPSG